MSNTNLDHLKREFAKNWIKATSDVKPVGTMEVFADTGRRMRKHPIYLMNVIISLDQTFNAMADGNMDCTISARLGYLYVYRRTWWTSLLMKVVDITFYAVDGRGHCLGAYYLEQDEYYVRGSRVALGVLSVFVVLGCLLVVVPILLVALYKKFSRNG